MTLTELRYIVAVARELHFGRAAEACFVSQPTLSVGVRKLERELGVTLFERGRSEVSITPSGAPVIAQAQRVLAQAQALRELAGTVDDELCGTLRVGMIHTVGPYVLPLFIPQLKQRAPDLRLVVEEGFTTGLGQRLAAGNLDMVLLSLPFDTPGIRTAVVYEEPFVVVVPASHPWALRDHIKTTELGRESVLTLGAGHCFRDQVLAACPQRATARAATADLRPTFEGGSLETIRHMVASGMGITVLPCTAAGADRYSQRLLHIVRFAAPAPSRSVALAWRESFTRPRAVRATLEALHACKMSCVDMHALPDAAPA